MLSSWATTDRHQLSHLSAQGSFKHICLLCWAISLSNACGFNSHVFDCAVPSAADSYPACCR